MLVNRKMRFVPLGKNLPVINTNDFLLLQMDTLYVIVIIPSNIFFLTVYALINLYLTLAFTSLENYSNQQLNSLQYS